MPGGAVGWGAAPWRGVSGGDTGSVPADWREYDGRAPRRRGQAEALDHLLGQVKTVHQHCVCHGESAAPGGPGGLCCSPGLRDSPAEAQGAGVARRNGMSSGAARAVTPEEPTTPLPRLRVLLLGSRRSTLCSPLPRALQEPAPEQEALGLQEPQAPLPRWQQVPQDTEAVRASYGGGVAEPLGPQGCRVAQPGLQVLGVGPSLG